MAWSLVWRRGFSSTYQVPCGCDYLNVMSVSVSYYDGDGKRWTWRVWAGGCESCLCGYECAVTSLKSVSGFGGVGEYYLYGVFWVHGEWGWGEDSNYAHGGPEVCGFPYG